MKYTLIAIIAALVLSGCTDAELGKLSSYNGSAHVECYSGTLKIYDGISTGKVNNSEHSDGYYFVDLVDNKLKEVSGNCIITY